MSSLSLSSFNCSLYSKISVLNSGSKSNPVIPNSDNPKTSFGCSSPFSVLSVVSSDSSVLVVSSFAFLLILIVYIFLVVQLHILFY